MATVLISSAPISSARRTWVVTTSATSSIFSSVILPVLARALADPRIGPLLHHLPELPVYGLGDQHRVVFEPMSIAAQSIADG